MGFESGLPGGVDRWTTAILCAATFVLACWLTLPGPYFLDSFGYVAWIEQWRAGGELPSRYRYANTLLYYLPVSLFGAYGLKVVGVAVTTALAGTYYAMIRRDFSRPAALGAALLFLAAPPTVITATHLKEDLTSLLFFSIALLLVRPGAGPARTAAAGAAYGLSLLFKEVMLGAAPFAAAYVHLRGAGLHSYRECFRLREMCASTPRVLVFLAAAAALVLVVSPTRPGDFATMASSPYMGQFLGVFSAKQPVGLRYWSEALLHLDPWYLILVGFFAAGLRQRPPLQALYPVIAVVLLLFLANVTVVRMRHYVPVLFFLAPVLYGGMREGLDLIAELARVRGWRPRWSAIAALAICAVVAASHLAYVYPTLDYRLRYAPSPGFFAPLARRLPEDALLLGMDNCPIAEYESGLPCENHPPDLDAAAARRLAASVAEEASRRPVYVLPDFFDYDAAGHTQRAFASRFAMRPVYTGWWEPYHVMTYGSTVERAIERLAARHPRCEIEDRETRPVRVSPDLVLEEISLHLRCAARRAVRTLRAHRGHVTFLGRRSVSSLEPR